MGATKGRLAAAGAHYRLMMAVKGLISTSAMLATVPAMAIADSAQFNIVEQPLPAALRAFASQAHMQVLYQTNSVGNVKGNAVRGDLDKHMALSRLLRNTGLEAVYGPNDAATIRPIDITAPSTIAQSGQDPQANSEAAKEGRGSSSGTFRLAQATGRETSESVAVTPGASSADQSPQALTSLAEVLVTAQRRSERLLDVPETLTVVQNSELTGASIGNTLDLEQVAPGLQISNTGALTSIAIRGVSSTTSGPGADNNVATYVDGIYFPTKAAGAGIFEFPDVESIEILKGPQGAVYGLNATGGAILFKTFDPTFDLTGNFYGSYGSFKDREFKGMVSDGIVPDLIAGSLSVYDEKTDGYIRNAVSNSYIGGVESRLVRGKLLVTPSSNVKLLLTGYYSDRTDETTLSATAVNNNSDGLSVDPAAVVSSRYRYNAASYPNIIYNKDVGASGELDVDTNLGKLTVLSGFTKIRDLIYTDASNSTPSFSDFITNETERTFTEDAYFSSRKFGPAKFLLGVSYLNDSGFFQPVEVLIAGTPIVSVYSNVKTQSVATYFQGDVDITDHLNLTAGGRWSAEEQQLFGAYDSTAYPFVGSQRWTNFSPSAALRYSFTKDTNVYVNYSRGFKGGLLNSTLFAELSSVRPEIVNSVEAGFKTALASQLSLNVSTFLYHYSDIQVTTFQQGTTFVENAARARIYGADLDLKYVPIPQLTLSGGLELLHTQYTDFNNALVLIPRPAAACPPGIALCGNEDATANLTGNELPLAPKLTANGAAQYTLPIGRQTFDFYANLYLTGKFYWEAGDRLSQGGYALLNGRMGWNINSGHFTVSVWGKNLTNKEYYNSQAVGTAGDFLLSAPPRTVGISVSGSFL